MKDFIFAVFTSNDYGGYSSTMFTVRALTADLAVRNFWTLEGNGYEDEDYEGAVTVYDLTTKQVVYRYGCDK